LSKDGILYTATVMTSAKMVNIKRRKKLFCRINVWTTSTAKPLLILPLTSYLTRLKICMSH